MSNPEFRLRYDGGDARDHQIEMRALGRSLIGAEKIISDMLFLALERRPPKRGERGQVVVLARVSEPNCYDQVGVLAPAMGVLPFAYDVVVNFGTDFVTNAISYVLAKLGGRPKEADVYFTALMALTEQMRKDSAHQLEMAAQERDAIRAHELARGEQMVRLVELLRPPARQLVAPVGPTCDRLTIADSAGELVFDVDVPMADAIRAKEPLEVGDMVKWRVHVDTVSISRRAMKVEAPDRSDELIDAVIRDPAFDIDPDHNIYTDSLGEDLIIEAKPTYRAGTKELVKLHVMNAERASTP